MLRWLTDWYIARREGARLHQRSLACVRAIEECLHGIVWLPTEHADVQRIEFKGFRYRVTATRRGNHVIVRVYPLLGGIPSEPLMEWFQDKPDVIDDLCCSNFDSLESIAADFRV